MNKLACAAISVVAPTLLLSMGAFLKGLCSNIGFNNSCNMAFHSMKYFNELMISYNIFWGIKHSFDPDYSREKCICLVCGETVKLVPLFLSSACTYLVLALAEPAFAIFAVTSLDIFRQEEFMQFCAVQLKDLMDKMYNSFNRAPSNSNDLSI